ncbi:MAG: hypothetical protein LBN95_10080 [Prevotellaceae bacterium]|nr:hypothetical protein [Prevotellaceae bacterium]
MFKMILVLIVLILSTATNAQVTIGAGTMPNATLEVVSNANSTTADGVMMPRLTLVALADKDAMYSTAQTSAMVYVTDATPSITASEKTKNVTAIGYYYFDGTFWQAAKGSGGTTVDADNGLTLSNDSVLLGGTLLKNTKIEQDGKNLYTEGSGKVSVGAAPSSTSSKFEVNGASTNTQSYSTTGMNIDFMQSNLAYTTASAGSFTVTGLKDGGTYTLAVKGAISGTASFSQSGIIFHIVNSSATTAGKHTLYTFVVMGGDAYVWMTKGF